MIRKLALGLVACTLVVGCKGKQTQSDKNVETTPGAASTAIESTSLNFDPTGSDSGTIKGLKTIHFGYDKSSLDATAKQDISGNVEWMKKNSTAKLQIEGHCDARGTIEYNVALGERRANAVKSYMLSLGLAADRLSVISYGKEKPISTGDSEEVYAKNRRANFVPVQ